MGVGQTSSFYTIDYQSSENPMIVSSISGIVRIGCDNYILRRYNSMLPYNT